MYTPWYVLVGEALEAYSISQLACQFVYLSVCLCVHKKVILFIYDVAMALLYAFLS